MLLILEIFWWSKELMHTHTHTHCRRGNVRVRIPWRVVKTFLKILFFFYFVMFSQTFFSPPMTALYQHAWVLKLWQKMSANSVSFSLNSTPKMKWKSLSTVKSKALLVDANSISKWHTHFFSAIRWQIEHKDR